MIIGLSVITMKTTFLLTMVYLAYCVIDVQSVNVAAVNDRPIVGVLAVEDYPDDQVNISSYIASSYVKSIESAGARVVPLMIGQSRSYYEDIISKINGILFPGGDAPFNASNGYAEAGQYIYEIAMELNDAGDYFPIFGTCLGFEFLVVMFAGRFKQDLRFKCHSHDNLPLNFTKDIGSSKMFKDASKDVIELLSGENVTVNAHDLCIDDEALKSHHLENDFLVTSHSKDENGVEFIASIEHKRYPFFGTQFHPEKSAFEWHQSFHYTHSMNAVKVNRYFVDFFIDQCRKNCHSFANSTDENKYLIYNYDPVFTGKMYGGCFDQSYVFDNK